MIMAPPTRSGPTDPEPEEQASKNYKPTRHKPVAKAIHSFNQSATAKWVPINKSFITLTKIILRAASERYGLVNIAVTLRCVTQQGYRHLVLVNDDQDIHIAAVGRVEEFIISTEMPMTPASERLNAAEAVSIPVDFQQQRLGYIVALVRSSEIPPGARGQDDAAANTREVTRNLATLAEEIVAVIKRYQTRYRAIYVYGDQCYWIGNSMALRQLDQQIEQFAKSTLPVLIRGNRGTGKIIAARALHCERHADIVPFIESDCHEWQSGAAPSILQALYIYARGGTLFLRNVDKLSPGNFQSLQQFCFVKSADAAEREVHEGVDLIFSISERDVALTPTLTQWLELNSSDLHLPDLMERSDDFRDLARFFIHEYALNRCFDFTEDAWRLLEGLSWQENVDQLKRVIQKLAPMVDDDLIDAAQLEQLLAR